MNTTIDPGSHRPWVQAMLEAYQSLPRDTTYEQADALAILAWYIETGMAADEVDAYCRRQIRIILTDG